MISSVTSIPFLYNFLIALELTLSQQNLLMPLFIYSSKLSILNRISFKEEQP